MEEPLRRMQRDFKTDQRIYFNLGEGTRGYGTVLGLAVDHVVRLFIILLDEPLTTPDGRLHRAITVPASLMDSANNDETTGSSG
jgi:hypothetical protein